MGRWEYRRSGRGGVRKDIFGLAVFRVDKGFGLGVAIGGNEASTVESRFGYFSGRCERSANRGRDSCCSTHSVRHCCSTIDCFMDSK